MPTFVLKKYEEAKPADQVPEEGKVETGEDKETSVQEKEPQKEMLVEVSGSVSEIVAIALNKVFANKGVTVEETEDSKTTDAEAISTEDIEDDPVKALRSAKSGKSVLIVTEGFKTKKEEFFLENMKNYQGKVFYTVESFVDYLVSEMCDESNR